jgi:hypothetical protein
MRNTFTALETVGLKGGRIVRFKCDKNGDLSDKEVYGPIEWGQGAYPDGIAFDQLGNLWDTMVYSRQDFHYHPGRRRKDFSSIRAIMRRFRLWTTRFTQAVLQGKSCLKPAGALLPGRPACASADRILKRSTSAR